MQDKINGFNGYVDYTFDSTQHNPAAPASEGTEHSQPEPSNPMFGGLQPGPATRGTPFSISPGASSFAHVATPTHEQRFRAAQPPQAVPVAQTKAGPFPETPNFPPIGAHPTGLDYCGPMAEHMFRDMEQMLRFASLEQVPDDNYLPRSVTGASLNEAWNTSFVAQTNGESGLSHPHSLNGNGVDSAFALTLTTAAHYTATTVMSAPATTIGMSEAAALSIPVSRPTPHAPGYAAAVEAPLANTSAASAVQSKFPSLRTLPQGSRNIIAELTNDMMRNHTVPKAVLQNPDGSVSRRFKDVLASGRRWQVLTREYAVPRLTEIAATTPGYKVACQVSPADRQATMRQQSSTQTVSSQQVKEPSKRAADASGGSVVGTSAKRPAKRVKQEKVTIDTPKVELAPGDLDQAMARLTRKDQITAIFSLYKRHTSHTEGTQRQYQKLAERLFNGWEKADSNAPEPYDFLINKPFNKNGQFKDNYPRIHGEIDVHKPVLALHKSLNLEAAIRRDQIADTKGLAVAGSTGNTSKSATQ